MLVTEIKCRKCGKVKPVGEIKNGWNKSTLKGICKLCHNEYTRNHAKMKRKTMITEVDLFLKTKVR